MAVFPKSWILHLSSGCGCCTLKRCCNIQGYLMLVYNFALMCLTVAAGFFVVGYSHSYYSEGCATDRLAVLILLLVFFAVSAVANIAFLRGIFMKRPRLLKLHNWTLFGQLVLDVACVIWALLDSDYRWYIIPANIVHFGIWSYSLLCSEALLSKMQDPSAPVHPEILSLNNVPVRAEDLPPSYSKSPSGIV